ncbi:MAG: hypothetical protein ACE5FT_00155 [Candidatus Nanoarchaeia archaeon]
MGHGVHIWHREYPSKGVEQIVIGGTSISEKIPCENFNDEALTYAAVLAMSGRMGKARTDVLLRDLRGIARGRYVVRPLEKGGYRIVNPGSPAPMTYSPDDNDDLIPLINGPRWVGKGPISFTDSQLPDEVFETIESKQGPVKSKIQCALELAMLTPEEQLNGFNYAVYHRAYAGPGKTINGNGIAIEDLGDPNNKIVFESKNEEIGAKAIREATRYAIKLRTGFYLPTKDLARVNDFGNPRGWIECDRIGNNGETLYILRPMGGMTIETLAGPTYGLVKYSPNRPHPFANSVPGGLPRKTKDRKKRKCKDIPLNEKYWKIFQELQAVHLRTMNSVLEAKQVELETVSNITLDSIVSGITEPPICPEGF